jgi:putative ABC transport system permease protein
MVSPISAGGGFTRTGIGTIVDMDSLEFQVDVNENFINRVRPSQGVTAKLNAYPNWQIPTHVIAMIPTADRSYFKVHQSEFAIDDQPMAAFRATRSGALVNVALMKKFGWKVGDKVPIHSAIWSQKHGGSLDWTFDIVGGFDAKDPAQAGAQSTLLLFHYEYFDEGRGFGNGTVGWLEERVTNPQNSAEVSNQIDVLFANSSNETKTQPAQEFALTFVKQLGDISFILRAILGAVFFTLLFLTGNTMMQSARERIPDMAVLKTLGFSDGRVMSLVVAEALLLCVTAALAGLGLSLALLPLIRRGLQGAQLSPMALVPGIIIAVLLALVIGIPPAVRAMRLNIVDALAEQR